MITDIYKNIKITSSEFCRSVSHKYLTDIDGFPTCGILNVAQDLNCCPNPNLHDKIGLPDGELRTEEEINNYINCISFSCQKVVSNPEKPFIIHCHEGRSRSVVVCAGLLYFLNAFNSFDESLEYVIQKRGLNRPNELLIKSGEKVAKAYKITVGHYLSQLPPYQTLIGYKNLGDK